MARRDAGAIVVGAGVIGLAVALELRRREVDVLVLERDTPGAGATGAAGGMLGPVAEAPVEETELVTFGLDSLRRYPAFVEAVEAASGLPSGFGTEGTILVAMDRDHRAEQEHLAATLRERGLRATPLSRDAVLDREPLVSHRAVSGLLVEQDLRVDPRALAACLAAALRAAGGRLETGVAVDEIRAPDGRVDAVVTADGRELRAPIVVAAAGAWSWRDVRMPIPDPGLRPVKGQLLRLRGEPCLRHVVRSPDVYLIPQRDGELLVGATVEEQGFDARATAGGVHELLRHGRRVLPAIDELELAEVSVGLRPMVDDHLPVIGSTEVEGLHLAIGHGRKGILLAPATAHHLTEAILTGTVPEALAPFRLGRLTERRPG